MKKFNFAVVCLLVVGAFFAGGCGRLVLPPLPPPNTGCSAAADCPTGFNCLAGSCIGGGGGEKTVVLTEPPEAIVDGGADGLVVDEPLVDGGEVDAIPEVKAEKGGDSGPDVVPGDGGGVDAVPEVQAEGVGDSAPDVVSGDGGDRDRDSSPDHSPDVVPESSTEPSVCINGSTQVCYGGPASTQGVGSCRAGLKTCRNKRWGPCEGEVLPIAETCDGKDNDCDGQIDEGLTRTCYSGPVGTDGKGICKAGTQICSAGQWGQCQGEVTPTPEACGPNSVRNGVDEDCDGQKDEGCLECNPGTLRLCSVSGFPKGTPCSSGNQRCNATGKWEACKGRSPDASETCGNGIDDDCNGKVDDGCP